MIETVRQIICKDRRRTIDKVSMLVGLVMELVIKF